MIEAKMILPAMITKVFWAGVCNNDDCDVIGFFNVKPVKDELGNYGIYDNSDIISAVMYLSDFSEYWPSADISKYLDDEGRPKNTKMKEIFQIKLTYIPDANEDIAGIDLSMDL